MRTETYILPDWTLCPLFNGDISGTTEEEDEKLDNFLEREKLGFAVACEEIGFEISNDLDNLGGDCHRVTFEVRS